MKKIIINDEEDKEIIALLENEKLVEEYEEEPNNRKLEGNIYCGIVKNILPGMQSAFVDIGEGKNTFIHIKDILPKVSNETGNKDEKFEEYDIKKYIKTGDSILVQVKKDEENKKGARISKHISLTGKYVVINPDVDFVTVSKKIENEDKRNELKENVQNMLKSINNSSEKYGIIIRTAAMCATLKEIENDIYGLIEVWKKIINKYNKVKMNKKAVRICDAQDIATKVIIGVAITEECEICVNTEALFDKVNKIIRAVQNKKVNAKLIKKDLLNMFDLQEQINRCKDRKVWLKCGGFITIDKTEALTAIDVNSGKFVGKKHNSKDETLVKVNLEATIEIAKQIRLKNISGIIVIDYIDMENNDDRKEILNLLEEELKKDRSKAQIIGFTKLDLLEITRKKL